MAKTLSNFEPTVNIGGGITPAGGTFPVVESHDVLVGSDGKRLDTKLTELDSAIGGTGETSVATQLSQKVAKADITTGTPATSDGDTKVPSTKSVATALATKPTGTLSTAEPVAASTDAQIPTAKAVYTGLNKKINTADIASSVAATGSTSATKVPSETAVREAIEAKTIPLESSIPASDSNPSTTAAPTVAATRTAIDSAIDDASDDFDAKTAELQTAYDAFEDAVDDRITPIENRVTSLENGMIAVGTAAGMTDRSVIYIYTGSESGYTNGHWYYDSTPSGDNPTWTDGGAVGGLAIDTNLNTAGAAADAKATGDAITELSNDITLNQDNLTVISQNVSCICYPSEGKPVSFTDYSNSTTILDIGSSDLVLRSSNNTVHTILNADILNACANAGLTIDGSKISGTSYALYFSIQDEQIHATDRIGIDAIGYDKILIFAAHYKSFKAGLLMQYLINKQVLSNTESDDYSSDIADIKNNIAKLAYNNIFYAASGNKTTWTSLAENPSITIIGDFVLIYNTNIARTITQAEILEAATNAGLTVSENIISGTSFVISFNPVNDKIQCASGIGSANGRKYISNNFVLFAGHFKSFRDGLIVRAFYDSKITNLQDTVLNNSEQIQSINDNLSAISIPSYYTTHIQNKTSLALSKMLSIGKDGESFIFITDIHWENNNKNSPALVEYVLNKLNINTLICGGDLINEGDKQVMIETMRECIEKFKFKNILMPCAFGNHDNNSNGTTQDKYFSINEQYALMQKQAENKINYFTVTNNANQNWNFYFDINNTKTRFIILDTGTNGNYNRFPEFVQCLIDAPNNYNIIIIAHWLYQNQKTSTCIAIENIVDAFNSKQYVETTKGNFDLSNAKATIRFILAGHMHKDINWFTPNGIPVVLIDSDNGPRSGNTDFPYVKNTITEQSFGVFSISYTNDKIYETKIGRGFNSIFNTGINTIAVGSTLELISELTVSEWQSFDTNIATANNGVVTALQSGSVVISASDGETKEYFYIQVQ